MYNFPDYFLKNMFRMYTYVGLGTVKSLLELALN